MADTLQSIHPDDHLFAWLVAFCGSSSKAHQEYLRDGRRCAEMLREVMARHDALRPGVSILEFAAGYGRVSRHFKDVLPEAVITCSDIHPSANAFVAEMTGYPTIQSSSRPDEFVAHAEFDVIFVLSLFSHLSFRVWSPWLKALYTTVAPNGLLILTTHGRLSSRPVDAMNPAPGFRFHTNSDQPDLNPADYGSTFVEREFVSTQINALPQATLVAFEEGYWWGHQDMYVIRKASKTPSRIPGKDEVVRLLRRWRGWRPSRP